ncbi:Dam family site-specific DNA-(adenine-N6)-methyltransferase [Corynebacterium sp. HMSC056E09]|uniref:Dam family site-specific DNA-(adenine-N6)-methyltransferase n=1 Tax=Corynebacterium sp. HMSC056E09 TaxID=1739416 RepID=UPI000AB01BDD|nr:Dam family site-specific DNA-(adenine-N6)-methyltransferase [Corynebacterium sp. HMSC056E09]
MTTTSTALKHSAEMKFFETLKHGEFSNADELGERALREMEQKLVDKGVRVSRINNRRYLGNKHGLSSYIRETVDVHCPGVMSMIDIFSGTGAVADAFKDKNLITNDILYSNYVTNCCWFSPDSYRPNVIVEAIEHLNAIETNEDNYVRRCFADTYFSADDCSKIGVARELIEQARLQQLINKREFAILLTSILYGMDRIANTVGHYDAYRKGATFDKPLVFPVLLPSVGLSTKNMGYNSDANELIEKVSADLLYCDPPYNSRQYSDAYHLLENIARWEKPEVHGVARKMDRTALKSAYNTVRAAEAFRDLVAKADVKYIVLSYNNMAAKGNGRSNAKITDEDIIEILSEKGDVQIFEQPYKAFSAGKSEISGNAERLFVCTVKPSSKPAGGVVLSPINYIGGKGKLVPQLRPLLPTTSLFVDLFAGGCTVGANVNADRVIFNDINRPLVELIQFLADNDPVETISAVDEIRRKYGFSDTFRNSYNYYGVDSSLGLAGVNRVPFLRLRESYNKRNIVDRDPLLLYVLVLYGFNNQLRFNKKGEFNLPVGKRDFNSRMRTKLLNFHKRIATMDACFQIGDFRDFDIAQTPLDTVFYCDPPYLITQATYNENGGWSESHEYDLLSFLEKVHDSGRRFALSNVIEAKGAVNRILSEWVGKLAFNVHNLSMSYKNSNYQRANRSSSTLEVLITNY